MSVVVLDVFLQHQRQVAGPDDQQMVEALAAQRADEALGDQDRPRCPDCGVDDGDVGAGEHRVEGGYELGIAVADQEPKRGGVVVEVDEQVAGLLGDPGAGGWAVIPARCTWRRPCSMAIGEAAHEDGVDVGECAGDRPTPAPKSIARIAWACATKNCRQFGWTARSGIDARGLQDLPDRRRGDPVAEADQLTVDAAVAPAWVLSGQPQYLRGGWSAGLSSRVGPAAGHELGMPSQQRAW